MTTPARSIWPAVTVAVYALCVVLPAIMAVLYTHINPNPFSFTTDNVFWIGATWLTPVVFILAAGALGLGPRAPGAEAARIVAAAVTGFGLLIMVIIVVVQAVWSARSDLRLESLLILLSVLLAATAVVLAFLKARGTEHAVAPIFGLICLTVAAVAFAVSGLLPISAELPAFGVARELAGAVVPLVGVWLVTRERPAEAWAGAALLAVSVLLDIVGLVFAARAPFAVAALAIDFLITGLAVAAAVTAVLGAIAVSKARDASTRASRSGIPKPGH